MIVRLNARSKVSRGASKDLSKCFIKSDDKQQLYFKLRIYKPDSLTNLNIVIFNSYDHNFDQIKINKITMKVERISGPSQIWFRRFKTHFQKMLKLPSIS